MNVVGEVIFQYLQSGRVEMVKIILNWLQQCSNSSFSLVQSLSCVWLFVTSRTAACQVSLSITNSWSLLKLMSITSMMPSNHLILCHPILLPPSIFPSIRVFSNESALRIRWPKYWASASVLPMNIQGSFRMDWFDLLEGSPWDSQESSPAPQFESINSSVLSLLYGPARTSIHGKTKALTISTSVGKVTSLLFNMLSRFVIAFLPRRSVF